MAVTARQLGLIQKQTHPVIKWVGGKRQLLFDLLNNMPKNYGRYFDPPYVPLNATSNFTSYTKDGFDLSMQFLLKEVCDELNMRGAYFMLSNSDTKFINEFYA